MKKLIIAAILAATLGACTTAGPYVTNISADGRNAFTIEKCKAQFNLFLGVIDNGDCMSTHITLPGGY